MNPNVEIDMLTTPDDRARLLMSTLREVNVTSKVGTPCGILAKLWITGASDPDSPLITLSREDTALAYAAGQSLAGEFPVVLMQNSGFGNCVNIMASLICPYDLQVILIVSLRGTANDTTPENTAMGSITENLLKAWNIPVKILADVSDRLLVKDIATRGPTAILISPEYFGWCP
ncbi:hypothetical protein D9O29_22970 [Pantoea vagans]|uniref:Sulfopyruvate decarboxylase subunit alpha n=1 Tax=Pantoea vagans TaxID=470934 RepID=A0ABY3L9G8_9GAMM|nr:hypothetical protein D9O29_22970 [Pantoea vagans]